MLCFQNVHLINLRHLITMVEQLIRLIVPSQTILRPPRSSKFADRSLPPAVRPLSWCSTSLLFSSNHVKFYVIKTQHSSWYLDSQMLGSRFILYYYYFFLSRRAGYHILPPPLIEFILECLLRKCSASGHTPPWYVVMVIYSWTTPSCGLGHKMCFTVSSPFFWFLWVSIDTWNFRLAPSWCFSKNSLGRPFFFLLLSNSHGSSIIYLSPSSLYAVYQCSLSVLLKVSTTTFVTLQLNDRWIIFSNSAIASLFPMTLYYSFDSIIHEPYHSTPLLNSPSSNTDEVKPCLCPLSSPYHGPVSESSFPLSLRVLGFWPWTLFTLRFSFLKVSINKHTYKLQLNRTLHMQVSQSLHKQSTSQITYRKAN